jgi:hypothetical protein
LTEETIRVDRHVLVREIYPISWGGLRGYLLPSLGKMILAGIR